MKTLERLDFASTLDADALASLEKIHLIGSMKDLRELEPAAAQYALLKRILPDLVVSGQSDTIQRMRGMTIAINMERLRWKRKPYDRYISVNIPAFVLRVVEKDSLWLETRVIVGKPETPTPVMESIIRSFIIYPYWHAPFSIATKELLPALQNDAAYLRKNNFEVLNRAGKEILADTIQWDLYSRNYFPFILRQREGFENSMGIIKFVFANNYGVYLHDTNSKRLFSAAKRDLSHGCVRVSNAVALAHYLVREDDIYVSPEDLDQYLSLQQRLTIELRKPIHLRLDYFTAEVRDGVPFFYEDIYKKDSVMLQALYPPVGDEVPGHLAGL
jgi:murein L,D-transpeptidase YcbB/YkuD